jgi:plasmid stability protein
MYVYTYVRVYSRISWKWSSSMPSRWPGKMVLRTVYLPEGLDQELRAVAFRSERSKNDVIRRFVEAGLLENPERLPKKKAKAAKSVRKAVRRRSGKAVKSALRA